MIHLRVAEGIETEGETQFKSSPLGQSEQNENELAVLVSSQTSRSGAIVVRLFLSKSVIAIFELLI